MVAITVLVFLLCYPLCSSGKEIKIGVIYPLTGPAGATGQLLKKAVEFACDVINNKYALDIPLAKSQGITGLGGAKITVVYADHQGKPDVGKKEAERLILKNKVKALFGCYYSSVTATASEVAERLKMPFLNATSTSPTLTKRGFKWFFRTTPHDGLFAENFFQFLDDIKKKKGIDFSKFAILGENTLWGVGVTRAELGFAKKYGYEAVAAIQYPAKCKSLLNEVKILKNLKPQILLQASYVSDAVLSMRAYKRLNFSPNAILAMDAGFITPKFIRDLGNDANYILSREVWSYDLGVKKPLVKTISDLFKKRTGKKMDGNSARAFTGMIVLADAINRAGSTDPRAIRNALSKTHMSADQLIVPWKGIRFDPDTHQNTQGRGIIVQIQDKAYHTVWPFDLASKDIIWPFPNWKKR
ncbi:MAG TPA: branched-chain amino acid ABC transporter substrate-binding protein [Desulfobacteraceae bacterium]|nr:branched-chain amino acid ABC transporter substrate-binding protein [Desulfobacteraceae bacterium]